MWGVLYVLVFNLFGFVLFGVFVVVVVECLCCSLFVIVGWVLRVGS